MTFVCLDIEKKVTHREPNRCMFTIRGTTFTHCRAFLFWLYRFCFEKKDSNGQDLIMVPNENETEMRGLLIVVQKLYMMILKFCLKYPKKPIMLEKVPFQVNFIGLLSPANFLKQLQTFVIKKYSYRRVLSLQKSEMIKAFN